SVGYEGLVASGLELLTGAFDEQCDGLGTDVVASARVFPARVSQPDDESVDHARVRSLGRVGGGSVLAFAAFAAFALFAFALFAFGDRLFDLGGRGQDGDDGHVGIAEGDDTLRHREVGQADDRVGLHVGDVDDELVGHVG